MKQLQCCGHGLQFVGAFLLGVLTFAPGCGSDDDDSSSPSGTGGSGGSESGGSGGSSGEGGSAGVSGSGGSGGSAGTSGSGGSSGQAGSGGSGGAGGASVDGWTFVGDALNRTAAYGDNSQMLDYADQPTVVWVEHSGGSAAQISASTWDGTAWVPMDPPAQGGAQEAVSVHTNGVPPTATVWQDTLYVGWDTEDTSTGDKNTWIMAYDGTWKDAVNITPPPSTLPGNNLGWSLSLRGNSDTLVASYLAMVNSSSGAEVRTQSWDGTAFGSESSLNTYGANWTAWALRSAVSPTGNVLRVVLVETANDGDYRFATFFNDDAPSNAPSESMMVDDIPQLDVAYWDETPVLALAQETGISVFQYDGTSWTRMGQGYLTVIADSIQLLPCAPDVLVHDGEVYVAWAEAGSAMNQTNAGIQVRHWTGTEWEDLGTGIAHDPSSMIVTTTGPSLAVVGDELWLSFSEVNGVNRVYVAHRPLP